MVRVRDSSWDPVAEQRPVNHTLHLVLTGLTGGLWLIPWAILIHVTGDRPADRWAGDD